MSTMAISWPEFSGDTTNRVDNVVVGIVGRLNITQ